MTFLARSPKRKSKQKLATPEEPTLINDQVIEPATMPDILHDPMSVSTAPTVPPLSSQLKEAQALFTAGQWEAARQAFAQAAATLTGAEHAVALLQAARCEVRLGRFMPAREAFAQVLRADANNFSAWLEAGHLCRQYGVLQQALSLYRQAAALAPQRWEGQLSLVRILEELDQHEAAARVYEAALHTCPTGTHLQLHWRTGSYRLARGDVPRAVEALRLALVLAAEPSPLANARLYPEVALDLGVCLLRLGLKEQAQRYFEVAARSEHEDTLVRLGQDLFAFNEWAQAEDVLRRNLALHPQSVLALQNLAHLLAHIWRGDEAEALLQRAESLGGAPAALAIRSRIASAVGDADGARRLKQQLLAENPTQEELRSQIAMLALYSDELTPEQVAQLHRELFAHWGTGARPLERPVDPTPQRPLRLGLLTADLFHQHPVNLFMQPILARLDKSQFEVVVYYAKGAYDEQTRLARSRVALWRDVGAWRVERLRQQIADDGIDILMDLSGHTGLNQLPLMAQRAAPLQLSFLGYPGSTGVPNVDGLLADPVVVPEGTEALYSERLLRLPNTVFCYAPETPQPETVFADEREHAPLVFGSFNNIVKLTPHTVRLWARVLQAVPASRLLLKAASLNDAQAIAVCRQRFEAEGVDASRITFRGPTALHEMMAEYLEVDIALDTFPYNGGTTTAQALWMGAPVITRSGQTFAARMGASFMQAAGLPNWVAQDDDAFVAIAQRWAQDRAGLLALKRGLRQQLQAQPAWDIDQYVRDWQSALRQAWQERTTTAASA